MDCEWTFFSVDVELTNRCTENCAMCPRHRLTRPQGMMSEEVFARVLSLAERFASRVTFSGFGNPLFHPKWRDCVDRVRAVGLPAGLVLHPSVLTMETLQMLQEHPPSHLEVSFPSVDPGYFSVLCPNMGFHQALDRVMELRRLDVAPLVCVGLETPNSPESPATYRRFWKGRSVRSRVFPCHSRGGFLTDRQLLLARQAASVSCGLLAIHGFITWNGEVLACCHDLCGETRIGNVMRDEPLEIARLKWRYAADPPWRLCRSCDEFRKAWPLPSGPCPRDLSERGRCLARVTRKQ
ncbi:MAG: radical SAM/SPASM domain-containing protein [Pseudomonadota bacterium]